MHLYFLYHVNFDDFNNLFVTMSRTMWNDVIVNVVSKKIIAR